MPKKKFMPFEYVVEITDYQTKFSVGKKSYVLNGQNLYNSKMHWTTRNALKKLAGEYFKKHIKKAVDLGTFTIPKEWIGKLAIRIEIHSKMQGPKWDCDNKWLVHKIVQDIFVEMGLIPDDSIACIVDGGRTVFVEQDKNSNEPTRLKIIVSKCELV
jgi:hypothetical protein